jgi:hypothetical protein
MLPTHCLPLVRSLALLSLLCVGCTTAQETRPLNSDDVDRSVTLPCTLPDVWYRPATKTEFGIPFTSTGTLIVTAETVQFTHDGSTMSIPVGAITSVVWRNMAGDRENEWAVVTWLDGESEQVAGFTAANAYRYHTSNKQLYSALVVAAGPAGGN